MNGVRLVVNRPMENLRELLEGEFYGLFASVQLAEGYDSTGIEDLVDAVQPSGEAAVDLGPALRSSDALRDWLSTALPHSPTMLGADAAANPVHVALQLFLPGIPCVEWSQLRASVLELIEFRSSHPAFFGDFSFEIPSDGEARLSWDLGIEFARLSINFQSGTAEISHSSPDGKEVFPVPNN